MLHNTFWSVVKVFVVRHSAEGKVVFRW